MKIPTILTGLKWRRLLPILMLLISLGLYGFASYRLWRFTRGGHAGHGLIYFERSMWETYVLFGLNLPASVACSPVRMPLFNTPIGPFEFYVGKGFFFSYGDAVHFTAIYFFWWWAGKQLDERMNTPPGRSARICYCVLAGMSCLLGLLGILTLSPWATALHLRGGERWQDWIIGGAAIVWGSVLGTYFVASIRSSLSRHLVAGS